MILRALTSLLMLGLALFGAVLFAIDWFGFVGGWAGWLIGALIGVVGVKFAWEGWAKEEHKHWMRGFWRELTEAADACIRAGGAVSAEPVVEVAFPAADDSAGGFRWDGSAALLHHADGASSAVDISGERLKERLTLLARVHPPAPGSILTVTPTETLVSPPGRLQGR